VFRVVRTAKTARKTFHLDACFQMIARDCDAHVGSAQTFGNVWDGHVHVVLVLIPRKALSKNVFQKNQKTKKRLTLFIEPILANAL
jgi:hypothetical protein